MNYNYKLIDCVVGETYLVRNIRVVCIVAGKAYAINNDTPLILEIQHPGDKPIFVDKDHDLSYYINGSDFLNTSEGSSLISNTAKYGYEWGGNGTTTGITATGVGTGLSNTNALIGMNLQSNSPDWWVVWDKVKDFRASYGHNWFVPSKDELNLIYQQISNLSNISTSSSGHSYYRSSSERRERTAWAQYFNNGSQDDIVKYIHSVRVRLCSQI